MVVHGQHACWVSGRALRFHRRHLWHPLRARVRYECTVTNAHSAVYGTKDWMCVYVKTTTTTVTAKWGSETEERGVAVGTERKG